MRALVVPSAVGYAHVGRTLAVAHRLAERGHRVTFAFGGADTGPISGAGFDVQPCHDVPADPASNIYAQWREDDTERAVADLTSLARELRPDVVIADLHPLATIAAQAMGIPSAALVTAGFTPEAAALTGATGRTAQWARRALAARSAMLARPFAAAARRRGQRGRDTLAGTFRGDTTLVTELASFAGPAASGTCTGPIVWDEPGAPPPPPPPGVARIYATIGTTGDPALLELALAAFAGRPGFQLVLTSGRLAAQPVVSDGVLAAPTLPGSAVLRHARLAVHAGGSGTTYQALSAGVPMLVVPRVGGQDLQARLVQRHGVGISYRLDRLSAERLRRGAMHVLTTDRYRARAAAFARELAGVDGPGAVAYAVEGLVGVRAR